jgi:hypothetical protein
MGVQGWYRDPYGIHGDRWFSDGRPTRLVRDERAESYDDPPPGELPLPLVPAAEIQESDGLDLLRADGPPKRKRNYMDGCGALGIGFN